jgi:hypothetical protein
MVVWRRGGDLMEASDDAVGTGGGTVTEVGDSIAESEDQQLG